MVEEELGCLEAGGEFGLGGVFDDARAGEANHGAGFGDYEIANAGVAGHDAGVCGISEDADVGEAGARVVGEGTAGLGHLHEAEHAFIHAGAAAGRDDDDRKGFFSAGFNEAREFFANDTAHGAGEEVGFHDGKGEAVGANFADAGDDGFDGSGFFLVVGDFFGIARELERIEAGHAGVHFFKRAGFDEGMDAFAGAEGEVESAVLTDLEVFIQVFVVKHRGTLFALGPKPFGDVAFAGFGGADLGLFEEAGVCRGGRGRDGGFGLFGAEGFFGKGAGGHRYVGLGVWGHRV